MRASNYSPTWRYCCVLVNNPVLFASVLYGALFKSLFTAMDCTVAFQETGILPNLIICKILMRQSKFSFAYKALVCQQMKKFGICPDKEFIAMIEDVCVKTERIITSQVVFESFYYLL